MTFKLINCAKAWELGPVEVARLRRLESTARAMGNNAGANVLAAQADRLERQWEHTKARHEAPPMVWKGDGKPLTKIDTQGT